MPIMLVDDNPLMQQVISRFLVSQGYEVVVAPNGADALRMAQEQRCELLLIDLNLPDQDGPELLAALRKVPSLATIPAIAISGMGDTQRLEVQRFGFNDYFSKPIDLDELLDRVKYHIKQHGEREVGLRQL